MVDTEANPGLERENVDQCKIPGEFQGVSVSRHPQVIDRLEIVRRSSLWECLARVPSCFEIF